MHERHRITWRLVRLLGMVGAGLALALGLLSAPAPARATAHIPAVGAASFYAGDGALSTLQRGAGDGPWAMRPAAVFTRHIYLPLIDVADTCPTIPGESYGTLDVDGPATDRPAEAHADLNLALRSYELTNAHKGLWDYNGPGDAGAPQLPGLFADNRTAVFTNVYRVYDWNWGCNCRGSLLANWPVTLAGLETSPGETIHTPNSGGSLGNGYEVLVLYASMERITLKYTREDNVVRGYTIHMENVCVEPNLLALYETWNSQGRGRLPALRPGQAFGTATGNEIGVAIRDTGEFMDPRSRKDWWR